MKIKLTFVIIAIAIIALFVISGCEEKVEQVNPAQPTDQQQPPQGCPEDAKVCPDGSIVMRVPTNNCEFPECPEPTISDFAACRNDGGDWAEYPNACRDSCAIIEDPGLICAQVLTEGCDCGENKCWDDDAQRCVVNQ